MPKESEFEQSVLYASEDLFKLNLFVISLLTFKVPKDNVFKIASKFLCSVHLTKPVG